MYDMTPLTRFEVAGPRRGGVPAAADHQQRRQDRRLGHLHAAARRDRRRSAATSPSPGSPPTGSRSAPTARSTSTGCTRHLPDDGTVTVRDITGGTCCVGVWGPRARDLVAAAVPPTTCRTRRSTTSARTPTYLGAVPVTMLRLSYVGELGWEIYTSADLRAGAVGHAVGGGQRARRHRRGPGRVQQPAAGEGLPARGAPT